MKAVLLLSFAICAFKNVKTQSELTAVLKIDKGQIQGTVQEVEGKRINVFQGIPYGRAKRFKKPDSADSWNGVYNATSYRFSCPQVQIPLGTEQDLASQPDNINQTRYSNENCLYLNVWSTAQNQSSPPLAVMVWIHGDFTSGTIFSKIYDGQYLAALGNIIVVTVNYRVGPFGFLNGDDDDMANVGIYDQIEALKWVRKNIDKFGGDPKQVTIFGDSSGSSCVGILILSPKSAGLFQRAIMQSGSPISLSSTEDEKVGFAKTRLLGSMIGCTQRSKSDLVKCLQTKPVEEILNASQAMAEIGQEMRPVYGDDLLPQSPVECLLSGKFPNKKIDVLFGVTQNEGAPKVFELYPEIDANSTVAAENIEEFIENMMRLFRVPYMNQVLDYYAANLSTSNQTERRNVIENVLGDLVTVCPTIFFSEQYGQLQSGNKYYSYRLEQSLSYETSSCLSWMGACNGITVDYVFGAPIASNGTERDKQLSGDIIQAWTAFAKTGQPGTIGSVQWAPAFDSNSFMTKFMTFNSGGYQMNANGFYEQTCSFWKPKLIAMYRFGSDD